METTSTTHDRGHEPDEARGHSEPMPHHKVNYLAIFGLLCALTVVTVAIAFVHIERELVKVLVALLIASIKASFVCLYFMHLKYEGKLIYLILFLPVFLAVVLVVSLIPDVVHADVFNPLRSFAAGAGKP
jgi:cytochrome c oxidase subunit IV